MDIVEGVRKLGFRKWYERQLIDSHLAFTTCFLAGIVVASCLEALTFAELGWKPAALLAAVVASVVVGWLSWRRYITVLERAEVYGSRSTCPQCRTYARFEILSSGAQSEGAYLDPQAQALPYPWIRVRCRKCGTAWRMPD